MGCKKAMGYSRTAVGDACCSGQRSLQWCNRAGQGPLTPETRNRPARVRDGNPSQTEGHEKSLIEQQRVTVVPEAI